MPLRWITKPAPAPAQAPDEPVVVLVAPGTVKPMQRLSQILAASSLLAVAFRPLPRAEASSIVVANLNPAGPGSLYQAVQDANANPGPDTITFDPALAGTVALTATLRISDSVTIQGPGPGLLSVSGGNVRRVFYLYSPSHVPFTTTISGLTIRDGNNHTKFGGGGLFDNGATLTLDNVAVISNTASGSRGGGVAFEGDISNPAGLTIRNSVITGNYGGRGGGVSVYKSGGNVLIQNTQFLTNTATFNAAGLFLYKTYASTIVEDSTIADNKVTDSAAYGGGIELYKGSSAAHIVRRTTISGNTALRGGGVDIYKFYANPLVLENTTISGNHATNNGGGVRLTKSQNVTIHNSTIVSNTADVSAGGVNMVNSSLPIANTIIAGNLAPINRDISGTFQLSYDLVQVTGTATITVNTGNVFGLDPLLGPLADNGGPTQTHLPAHNSPAVNAGDPAFAPPPTTDQRGRPRLNGRLDIGAVEVENNLFLPLLRR